ncbi:hypothetical protein BX666DRAFT_2119693 [Dichotomocladium elegans]|nr:hypothetical protein BX666DRAFT_2119693 [Dichotomocladium elegans]
MSYAAGIPTPFPHPPLPPQRQLTMFQFPMRRSRLRAEQSHHAHSSVVSVPSAVARCHEGIVHPIDSRTASKRTLAYCFQHKRQYHHLCRCHADKYACTRVGDCVHKCW